VLFGGSTPDTIPPVIKLNGNPIVQIPIFSPYTDQGAFAVDNRDGPGARQEAAEVQQCCINSLTSLCATRAVPVTVSGLPTGANWTAVVTPASTPIIVTYSASDRAGNVANITRTLFVIDPCTISNAAEHTCNTTLVCSVNGKCSAATAALSSLFAAGSTSPTSSTSASPPPPASAAAQQAIAALSVPDTTPPSISIIGVGQLFFTPSGSTGMINNVTVGQTFTDPGALAFDIRTANPGVLINITNKIVVRTRLLPL
jgi:hypothetical protein